MKACSHTDSLPIRPLAGDILNKRVLRERETEERYRNYKKKKKSVQCLEKTSPATAARFLMHNIG